jgi:hypothetical protein
MTVLIAWNRKDVLRNNRVHMIKVTYGSGNTTLTIPTGLKKIYSFDVSPTATTSDYVTNQAVSGGTITLTVTDSTPSTSYVFVTAYGI